MEPSLNEVCKKASTKQILDLRLSVCVFGNKLIAKNNSFFFKLSHKAEKNKGFLFLQNKQNQTNRTLKKKKKTIHSLPYHFPNIHTSTVTEMTKKKKDIKQKNQRHKNLGFHWHPILISKTKFGVGKKRNSPKRAASSCSTWSSTSRGGSPKPKGRTSAPPRRWNLASTELRGPRRG